MIVSAPPECMLVRLSIHPTMTNAEIDYIMNAIATVASCFDKWEKDYSYDPGSNEYSFRHMGTSREVNLLPLRLHF